MADKKISQLTELVTVEDNDYTVVVDITDDTTKRATKASFKGDIGTAATIDAGTTTTGDAGTNASVINSGSTSAAIFDFTIPRGDVGATGLTGLQGIQGIQGITGNTGDTGDTGEQGIQGIQGIQGETGLTGDTGLTGEQGIQGIQGETGDAGLDVNWLGAYVAETAYVINDAVSYDGSSYICKLDSTGNLPTNTTYFDLMALKGTDGEGTGDMLKSVYDSNDDGVIAKAQLDADLANTSGTNTGDQDLSDLSGTAGAAFSFNSQNITNVGDITSTTTTADQLRINYSSALKSHFVWNNDDSCIDLIFD